MSLGPKKLQITVFSDFNRYLSIFLFGFSQFSINSYINYYTSAKVGRIVILANRFFVDFSLFEIGTDGKLTGTLIGFLLAPFVGHSRVGPSHLLRADARRTGENRGKPFLLGLEQRPNNTPTTRESNGRHEKTPGRLKITERFATQLPLWTTRSATSLRLALLNRSSEPTR